ncbi:SA1788 family PVL leukocidin-associated protein [Staphylococcus caeli]|uniref:SA1788 family PVL leukocidin-associated protein n=1 Tax=Staphylococcus caeli TaxID=2201815 RepID=UPI003F5746B5
MKTISAYGVEYDILGDNLKAVERNGISVQGLRSRILSGWSLYDACHVPKRTDKAEYEMLKGVREYEYDNTEAKEKYQDERLRKEKPHLFNVPQQHSRGKWCEYLMETSIFPKAVH